MMNNLGLRIFITMTLVICFIVAMVIDANQGTFKLLAFVTMVNMLVNVLAMNLDKGLK